jgi:hypothetical protein
VETSLFKIPRSLFAGSDIFHVMFSLPPADAAAGSSDECPLILPGVTAIEFRVFVRAALSRSACPSAVRLFRSRPTPLET